MPLFDASLTSLVARFEPKRSVVDVTGEIDFGRTR